MNCARIELAVITDCAIAKTEEVESEISYRRNWVFNPNSWTDWTVFRLVVESFSTLPKFGRKSTGNDLRYPQTGSGD